MGVLEPNPPPTGTWAKTRWSVIENLAPQEQPNWEEAWLHLVNAYRPPMERYVDRILRQGRGHLGEAESASDIVQSFLTDCVEKNWLPRAEKTKGRFRAFIQTLLRRYTYSRLRHSSARRRAPGKGNWTVATEDIELAVPLTPEDEKSTSAFDREWVAIAVDRALEVLRATHERYSIVIEDLISTDGTGSPDFEETMGVRRTQYHVIKHRARARFSKCFESELAATVRDPVAFEVEWRALSRYMP